MPLMPLVMTAILTLWFYIQMGLMFWLCEPKASSFRLRKGGLAFQLVCVLVLLGRLSTSAGPARHSPDHNRANELAAYLLDDWFVWLRVATALTPQAGAGRSKTWPRRTVSSRPLSRRSPPSRASPSSSLER
jgi:hypothetical protein